MEAKHVKGMGRASGVIASNSERRALHIGLFGVPLVGTFNLVCESDFDYQPTIQIGQHRFWHILLTAGVESRYGWHYRHATSRLENNYLEVYTRTPIPDDFCGDVDVEFLETWGIDRLPDHRWWAPFEWVSGASRPLADCDRVWDKIMLRESFEGKSVLDYGCHEGYYTFSALRAGAISVHGVDRDQHVIDVARMVNDHIEHLDANFIKGSDLSNAPDADIVFELSVYHQIDPAYKRLSERLEQLKSKASVVWTELMTPPLEGNVNPDKIVADAGGENVWSRKHPVRCNRTLYRIEC